MTTGFEVDEEIQFDAQGVEVDPAAHMDAFRAPDIDGETFAEDDPVQVGEDGEPIGGEIVEQMSREAWCALWETLFNIPGLMIPDFKPLSITDDKRPASNEAANAAYDLCEMHFPGVLMSTNDTFAAVARMVPFVIMQAGAVRVIVAERRRAASLSASAANDNRRPVEPDEEAAA